MIAVIGTRPTNELIHNIIGVRRKDFNIEYFSYTDLNQIEAIIQNDKIEGILFSGFIGLKAYEALENRPNVPYDMLSSDMISSVMYVLEIVLKYKEYKLDEIYFDYMDLLKQYSPDFYNMFPQEFVKLVKTFEFDKLENFTRENIYNDIKMKFEAGEIKVAVVSAAKISKELDELGILYNISTMVYEEDLNLSYQRLIKDVIQHKVNTLKYFTGVIEIDEDYQKQFFDKGTFNNISKTKDDKIITFKLKSDEITISHEQVYYKEMLEFNHFEKIRFGIGTGRTEIESEHNAFKALKYSKTFNDNQGFLLTDERDIYGPINHENCLKINEYQLESCYEYSRSVGIKSFNYCRLLALFNKKKLLSSEDVSEHLNIAQRSSNRILTILESKGIIEFSKSPVLTKIGRPQKKYRLMK